LSNFKTKLSTDPVYYTVTLGNLVFILLGDETGSGGISSAAQTWLQTTLENNQSNNIFILSHQGRKGTTKGTLIVSPTPGYISPVATIETDLGNNNWDAWFCGHSHGYTGMGSPNERGYYQGDTSRTDIDGDARSGSWDIGADEYVTAGGAVYSGRGIGRGIGRGVYR
jgi:hypothetical protein